MPNELVITTIAIKTYCLCLSMSTNNFYSISSSLEDEELELSFIELEPWLENEAMKYK
jgi:hypothetical protein